VPERAGSGRRKIMKMEKWDNDGHDDDDESKQTDRDNSTEKENRQYGTPCKRQVHGVDIHKCM